MKNSDNIGSKSIQIMITTMLLIKLLQSPVTIFLEALCKQKFLILCSYLPTIFQNVLSLVLKIFQYRATFECSTTSAWLNHLLNLWEKDKDCFWEWLANTDSKPFHHKNVLQCKIHFQRIWRIILILKIMKTTFNVTIIKYALLMN